MAKKIIILCLVLIGIMSCIGCNGDANNLTLTVKKSILGQEDIDKQEDALNQFVKAFNEVHPDINVQIKYVQEYPAELKDTEVVLLGADETLEYAPNDLKILPEKVSSGIPAAIAETGKLAIESQDKVQYMVPFNYDRAVVYVDKGLFNFLEAQIPAATWTYDDFVEAAINTTKSNCNYGDFRHATGVYLPIGKTYVWKYFYENLGDGWYNESYNVKFTSNKNLEVMESVLDLYKKNAKCYSMTLKNSYIYRAVTAMAWVNACQPECDDYRVISQEMSDALLGRRAEKVAEKGELLLLPLPSVNGKNMSYSNTDFIKGLAISKYIPENKVENAIKLVEFAQTLAGNSALNAYYGGIPSNEALWSESYWKTGLLSGENADNILIGIENDKRDDYVELLKADEAVYEKNLRLRAICTGSLQGEFRETSKTIKVYEKTMESMARHFNSTILSYGVPIGYNPDIIEKGA